MPTNSPANDVREIALSLIDPPPWNPRRDFDEAALERLSETIALESVGLLQPIIVRPHGKRFQVVAGERRYRAAARAARQTMRCTVRSLDDRESAEVQLIENVQRESLNPIETAIAFRVLCQMGHTESSLADLLQADEAHIGARLSLLSLPDEWQSRVRRGRITALQAEYLVPWATRSQVLAEMAKLAEIAGDVPLTEWRRYLASAVVAVSRSMNPEDADGPRFELSAELASGLDVVHVELSPGKLIKRAMNAELWDELQGRAEQPELQAPSAAVLRTGNETAPKRRRARPLAGRTESFTARLLDWKATFFRRLCSDAIKAAAPSELPGLADALGVDVAAHWQLRRDFLELFVGGRLEDLAADLGADVSACTDDSERIAVLLALAPRQLPRAFLDAAGPCLSRDPQ
jgi:ParB/RepB/Spo0J family partition protein